MNKKIKELIPIISIFIGSVIITFFLHISGVFSFLEMKLYDFRFSVRGAISGTPLYFETKLPSAEYFIDNNDNGIYDINIDTFNLEGYGCWEKEECALPCDDSQLCHNNKCVDYIECHDINQNGIWDKELDVVIVEKDAETYEYLNEPFPYSRRVWARVVRNLTKAGAKVITFDIEFDKPDHQIENLKNTLSKDDLLKIKYLDADKDFAEAIKYAKKNGTEVVLASTITTDLNRTPSRFKVDPYHTITSSNTTPYTALVDILPDNDGVTRLYPIFHKIDIMDDNYYYTLAVSSVLRYYDIQEDPKPKIDINNYEINVGPLDIPVYGKQQYFLVNFYGPTSNSFKTFKTYPLINILDTNDYLIGKLDSAYCMDDWDELALDYKTKESCESQEDYYWTTAYDSNWMDQYINPAHPLYFRFKDNNPFKGKIVYIGTSLAEDQDFKDTPFLSYQGGNFPMPGVEFHVNATQQIIDQNYIKYPLGKLVNESNYYLVHLSIIILLSFITLLVVTRLEPFTGFLFVSCEIFLWLSYSIGLFFNDYIWILKLVYNGIASNLWAINMPEFYQSAIVPVIFPAASIIIPYGINLSYKLIVESNNKKFLKESFGAYISPDLIDQMFDEKKEPKLGGDPGYHTMMFSDIASFSTFSEKLEAESLLNLLNEYLTAMTNILISNKGTLDKYIGDAIVAFYGAPINIKDHEYLACKTAIEMNKTLEELRIKWKSEGEKWPEIVHNMQHRIGINAGKIVVGNMGSEMKLNYTMTGDQVNLTARLESSAKQLGIIVQVGENIYKKVSDKFIFRDLGKVIVVGRNQSLNTYELICEVGEETEDIIKLLKYFHNGLECYHNQEWDKAISFFEKSNKYEDDIKSRKTNPSLVFIERSKRFKTEKLPANWDGVYSLDSK